MIFCEPVTILTAVEFFEVCGHPRRKFEGSTFALQVMLQAKELLAHTEYQKVFWRADVEQEWEHEVIGTRKNLRGLDRRIVNLKKVLACKDCQARTASSHHLFEQRTFYLHSQSDLLARNNRVEKTAQSGQSVAFRCAWMARWEEHSEALSAAAG